MTPLDPPFMPGYQHTQRSPLCLILYLLGIGLLVSATFIEPLRIIHGIVGMLVLMLAAGFHKLTVRDAGSALLIAFGPLPLFRCQIQYADMAQAIVGRTTLLEGWGIHVSPRGGWVWNLWGRDCVEIHHRRGVLRLGTDDAPALATFLNSRIASPTAA